jgi:hypothetical protein
MQDMFTDPSRDMPKTRKANVDTVNDFAMKQYDPYGFWKIHREKGGTIPDDLSGAFTSAKLAQDAINAYLNKK